MRDVTRQAKVSAKPPDFKTLFEATPGLCLVLAPDAPKFTIVAVSDAYARQTMTPREQILGMGIFEVFPDDPDDPQPSGVRDLRASLGRVLAHRVADTMPIRRCDVRHPDAQGGAFEERHWSPVNSPVLRRDGAVAYVLHRVEDVTGFMRRAQRGTEPARLLELNKLVADVRDSAARTAAIVDSTADAILTIDEVGQIATVNGAAERMFQFTADELLGRNVSVLMPAPYGDAHDHYLADYLSTGLKKVIGKGREVEGRRKDGTTFPLLLSVGEMTVDGRRMFTGILHDLTELKTLRRQLSEQEKRAAMGTMAAGIAHEVGNPLSVILAASQQLQRRMKDAPEELVVIREQVERAARVLREVTLLARPIREEEREIAVYAVIRATVGFARFDPRARDHSITVELMAGDPVVRGSGDKLTQILLNLILNAFDAMESAPGAVKVRTRRDGEQVVVEVSDCGCGIPPERIESLFKPFATTKSPGKGTGLGLWISRQLVDELGGTIRVESEVGKGTLFMVELRLLA